MFFSNNHPTSVSPDKIHTSPSLVISWIVMQISLELNLTQNSAIYICFKSYFSFPIFSLVPAWSPCLSSTAWSTGNTHKGLQLSMRRSKGNQRKKMIVFSEKYQYVQVTQKWIGKHFNALFTWKFCMRGCGLKKIFIFWKRQRSVTF